MTGGDSDQAIIRRILSGEKSSYALLVQRYQQDAYKLSLGILRHPADAEDAVSEAMVKAFAALTGGKTGEIASFKGWLLKITSHCCLDILRSRQKQKKHAANLERDVLPAGETPITHLLEEEQKQAVWNALACLSPEDRTAVVMKYYSGASYQDISGALNWAMGTVASRLSRAREKLRRSIEMESGGDSI